MKQCTFLQDWEEDSSQTESSDTTPSAPSSGIDTVVRSSEPELQKDGSQTSTSGKGMFDSSIHPNTPEEYIAFMQDSLVKTLALLENRQVYLREPDRVFTVKSCVSVAWFDQSSSSWKTYQQSLVEGWEPYSQTWPRLGMTQDGSAYAHPMSGRITPVIDGLRWPTPTSDGYKSDGQLQVLAKMCQTEAEFNAMTHRAAQSKKRKWWPTPSATDGKQAGQNGQLRDRLDYAVERGATKSKTYDPPQVPGGTLNPTWVEWLMGFPIGWTNLGDWVMPKSRSKPPQLTDFWEEYD